MAPTDEIIQRAPVSEVMALRIGVFSVEDVMTTKLLSIREPEPDSASVLELARREQIGWESVQANRIVAVREGVLRPRGTARDRRAGRRGPLTVALPM